MTKAENLHQIDIKIMRRAYHQNIRHFSKCQCVDSCEGHGERVLHGCFNALLAVTKSLLHAAGVTAY